VKITIKTANDAFQPNPCHEVARILRELADRIDGAGMPGKEEVWTLRDVNGNTIGAVV